MLVVHSRVKVACLSVPVCPNWREFEGDPIIPIDVISNKERACLSNVMAVGDVESDTIPIPNYYLRHLICIYPE